MTNLLRLAVVGKQEIFLLKSGHQAIHWIRNRHRNQHQVHFFFRVWVCVRSAGSEIPLGSAVGSVFFGLTRSEVNVVVLGRSRKHETSRPADTG